MSEHLFKTNEFNKPTTVSGSKEIAILIIRLILMDPGDNPLHPEMGVGLKTKYSFITEDELNDLKQAIDRQITVYLPDYTGVETTVTLVDKKLNISFKLDDTVYKFDDIINQTNSNISLDNLISQE